VTDRERTGTETDAQKPCTNLWHQMQAEAVDVACEDLQKISNISHSVDFLCISTLVYKATFAEVSPALE
jgi:hypothetical protein